MYWLEKDVKMFSEQENKTQINIAAVALMIIILTTIFFAFYSVWFVNACHKKLERIPIGIDSIVPHDTWVIVVLLSYALPAAGVVFKDLNLYISIVVILFWVLFLALSNTILPNPLSVSYTHLKHAVEKQNCMALRTRPTRQTTLQWTI